MFDTRNRYVIRDYQNQPTFSSFLPGIAGEMGIPVWCYYNNRGQAVCSFGVQDKDHAIMEFQSAHVSYQNVSRTGFRTFCKVNGTYAELFTDNCDMHIGMGELEIRCHTEQLEASCLYFGIPNENVGALARILTVRNISDKTVELELLDGMSAVVPFGVSEDSLKTMSNLAKAWMQTEDLNVGRAYFRVRASMQDTAEVTKVEGGNFCLGWEETGTVLKPLVQPGLVFGEDTALAIPRNFVKQSLESLCSAHQVTNNNFPCCFLPVKKSVAPGEAITVYSLYGQSEDKYRVMKLQERADVRWFDAKREEAAALVKGLTDAVQTQTADPVFDAYCRQTYLDNFLRGGVPMFFEDQGKRKPFYLYSRKHGDPEREYNYFSLGREYFAQGNGNFRDVCQNRRSDVLFAPELGAENIHMFYDLLQTDGYNPLVVTASTFRLPQSEISAVIAAVPGEYQDAAKKLLSGEFTPGTLAMAAESWGLNKEAARNLTAKAVCSAESEPNANFGEGYWCDHWTYNLDLIESYLSIYPEKKEELLFADRRYRWYEGRAVVNPREKRYCMTANGLRQYKAIEEKEAVSRKWMHTGDGIAARSTLIEKLLHLCAIKAATLDPEGMGVEMEGGKPGWYDALNGLPGIFGSSMAESCELARMIHFVAEALRRYSDNVEVYREVWELIGAVDTVFAQTKSGYDRWDRLNDYKEQYRLHTRNGFSGERVRVSSQWFAQRMLRMEKEVLDGIRRAVAIGKGVCPTYFSYEATKVTNNMPKEFKGTALPLFLEGPVRWLKLDTPIAEKAALAEAVRNSGLYDEKLQMYKVNESLASVSYEAGRTCAFTPGWLENESIWLHMEYKYLLELLKSGLYEQFDNAFRKAAVPFLNPAVYGRSPLENVSFIASSVSPDPALHGRGFVARLSGSTAEFLQMWQLMFFGDTPFRMEDGELTLTFAPHIPSYLMQAQIKATFLGGIPVTYLCGDLDALVPGKTKAAQYHIIFVDGKEATVETIRGVLAEAVRGKKVKEILVTMERC